MPVRTWCPPRSRTTCQQTWRRLQRWLLSSSGSALSPSLAISTRITTQRSSLPSGVLPPPVPRLGQVPHLSDSVYLALTCSSQQHGEFAAPPSQSIVLPPKLHRWTSVTDKPKDTYFSVQSKHGNRGAVHLDPISSPLYHATSLGSQTSMSMSHPQPTQVCDPKPLGAPMTVEQYTLHAGRRPHISKTIDLLWCWARILDRRS